MGNVSQETFQNYGNVIAERWAVLVLQTYPPDAATVFTKNPDPFANPVGATVRRAVKAIVLGELDAQRPEVVQAVSELMQMRAVQGLLPSEAVRPFLLLRQALRDVAAENSFQLSELAEFEARIEGLLLLAFDLYMAFRERIAEVRVRESYRSVRRLLERAGIAVDQALAAELGSLGSEVLR